MKEQTRIILSIILFILIAFYWIANPMAPISIGPILLIILVSATISLVFYLLLCFIPKKS